MQIGAVAQKTGLSVDAIRFYEKQGLLPTPPRSNGGYRLYAETDVERLDFVTRAQEWAFHFQIFASCWCLAMRKLKHVRMYVN